MASTKSLTATAETFVPGAKSQQKDPTTLSATDTAFVLGAGSELLSSHSLTAYQVAAPFGANVGAQDPRHFQCNGQAGFGSYLSHFHTAYQVAAPFGSNVGAPDPRQFQCNEQAGFDSYLAYGDGSGSDMSSIGADVDTRGERHALSIGGQDSSAGGAVLWMNPADATETTLDGGLVDLARFTSPGVAMNTKPSHTTVMTGRLARPRQETSVSTGTLRGSRPFDSASALVLGM